MAISVEDVFAVASQLAESGQQPTLAAVRTALGGGSFTTISEAMKSWRATQLAAASSTREAAPTAVMERINQLGIEVWSLAIGMANDRLAKEREAFEHAKADMAQAHSETAELADQMTVELEAVRAQIKQQGIELAAALESAQTANAALTEAQKRADGLAVLLEQERAQTREAQGKAEKAIADAAKLAGKLEALQHSARG